MADQAWWCRYCDDYVEAVERHRCFGWYCPNGCEGSCELIPDVRPLRSRIFQLEAAVEAADAMSELLRGYDYSDGSLAGKLLAAYDSAKAELERVKGG